MLLCRFLHFLPLLPNFLIMFGTPEIFIYYIFTLGEHRSIWLVCIVYVNSEVLNKMSVLLCVNIHIPVFYRELMRKMINRETAPRKECPGEAGGGE